MRILTMYNLRSDLDLGIGKVVCKWIPCIRLTCLEILKLPWDVSLNFNYRSRYGANERWIY